MSLVEGLPLEIENILEVGCGNGWLSEKLANMGAITGVDIADEAIKEAQQRVPSGTFIAGDILSLNLPNDSFDVIVSLETFSHVVDQPLFVHKLAGLLRSDGWLVLTTQNRNVYSKRSKTLDLRRRANCAGG